MFQKTEPQPHHPNNPIIGQPVADEVETIVGPSVKVEGDFVSEGNIVVKGIVCGNVQTSRVLKVEDGARIYANVKANSALIAGGVKGNVRVDDDLELASTAKIQGDVACRVLSVSPGALIQGKVTMKGIDFKEELDRPDKKKGLGRIKLGGLTDTEEPTLES
ncbi:MAG TPA: polymer-forming cytoskeletal protein [Patescibacteria group bacterium]|nr:polymer-forming cytoskeletal protein [Patescibacteria group bacterium]